MYHRGPSRVGAGPVGIHLQQCLAHELKRNRIEFRLEHPQPVHYKDILLDCGYRLDLFVESQLIIELKSVDKVLPIHEAQLLTYLKLSGLKIGLLMNFNVPRLKDGLKRFVL